MVDRDVRKYCVVGIGKHSLSKIIPSILQNQQRIVGIVTSKKNFKYENVTIFYELKSAIEKLPINTVFVICSPPHAHFHQALEIITSKRDVFIEKPACLKKKELKELVKVIELNRDIIFVEILIHFNTKIYVEFKNFWNKNKLQISKIETLFTIPEFPENTFRNDEKIESSILFDMGCYPISLMVDLDLPVEKLNIVEVRKGNNIINYIKIIGNLKNIEVSIEIGNQLDYKNFVKINHVDGSNLIFTPFYFGRSGSKQIINSKKDKPKIQINDINAFENIFKIKKKKWLETQNIRLSKLIKVTSCLEKFSKII